MGMRGREGLEELESLEELEKPESLEEIEPLDSLENPDDSGASCAALCDGAGADEQEIIRAERAGSKSLMAFMLLIS
jgi:hypothetical protein